MLGKKVPSVVFKVRNKDEKFTGENPYKWTEIKTEDYFYNKKIILFSSPGAFGPICSNNQLSDFERLAPKFKELGIDSIYGISVNDTFVVNAWAKLQNLKNIKLIPDGSAEFTKKMNMLVAKDNFGFGKRSWRYAAVVINGWIKAWFEEPGFSDNCPVDPYGRTSPHFILDKANEWLNW